MEIRRCGNSWVCCDGECDKCKANKIIYTDRTQPPKGEQLWLIEYKEGIAWILTE